MYIIELITKLIKEKNLNKKQAPNMPLEIDYEEKCNHTFFPIDSTNETLACSKCGLIIKSSELNIKPKNPFN